MSSDGLYSINYINVLSTTAPTSVISNVTSDYCKQQCNANIVCNAYTFIPTYSLTCVSTQSPIDLTKCTKTDGLTAGATSTYGNCHILGEGSESKISPLYVKNACDAYESICSVVWTSHWTVFGGIMVSLLLLNMYLMRVCFGIKAKFYRIVDRKMAMYVLLAIIILTCIIVAIAARANQ